MLKSFFRLRFGNDVRDRTNKRFLPANHVEPSDQHRPLDPLIIIVRIPSYAHLNQPVEPRNRSLLLPLDTLHFNTKILSHLDVLCAQKVVLPLYVVAICDLLFYTLTESVLVLRVFGVFEPSSRYVKLVLLLVIRNRVEEVLFVPLIADDFLPFFHSSLGPDVVKPGEVARQNQFPPVPQPRFL